MDKTIQEKLTTIAENRPKIYENGKNDGIRIGRDEVIDNSKYIPKSAVGKFISLNDVSEVSHKVKVVGVGNEVDLYGKNLFDISTDTRFTQQEDGSYITNERVPNIEIPYALPYGTYTLSYDMSCAVGRNARIKIYLKDGTSVEDYKASTGEFLHYEKVITGEIVAWGIYYSTTPQAGELVIKNAQIEVGSLATSSYEPYTKQTITATPLGTEIPSMCPVMNFIADEDIQVNYYSSFGMQTEYDRFWDGYQDRGNRREYGNAFAGVGWNDTTFKPKYDIVVTSGSNLFLASKITDIVKSLDECGVTLNTSNCTIFSYAMQGMISKSFPLLDLSACTSAPTNLFNNCQNLEYIVGIVSSEKTKFHNMGFGSCPKLTHVIFSGVIASDINLQWSKLLDEESLVSISVTLCDLVFSGFGDGWGSRTLTLSPESIAQLKELPYPPDDLNPEGAPYAEDGASCYDVIVGRKGWNIA